MSGDHIRAMAVRVMRPKLSDDGLAVKVVALKVEVPVWAAVQGIVRDSIEREVDHRVR